MCPWRIGVQRLVNLERPPHGALLLETGPRAHVVQVLWRGRASPQRRDTLRRAFVACPHLLSQQNKTQDATLFNLWDPPFMAMQDYCQAR